MMQKITPRLEAQNFIKAIEQALPPIFARHHLTKLTGGLINSRTIANKMSKGIGPPGIRIGRNVGFARSSFIDWLRKGNVKTIK